MRISPPGPESRVYRPSELNQEVKLHLEAGFPRLWIEAELSNLARPPSGHLYFTLKDPRAQIRCALFKGSARQIAFQPDNGMKVLVRGRLSLYEARGDYQLIADAMLEAGAGSLQQAFEATRKQLESEGLFEAARKKPLPAWPKNIAVVTSPAGAAIRDILKVLSQRWPAARVRIYPTLVQGEAAAPGIIAALQAADRHRFADVILLARGGGSLEDLWAFNDEALARAIAAAERPVVTGVGHETDTTIVDFVSDLRAPTPSAAAAAMTPDGPALRLQLGSLDRRCLRGIDNNLNRQSQTIDYLSRRLEQHRPDRRLDELAKRLDTLDQRLRQSVSARLERHGQALDGAGRRLQARHPARQVERALTATDQFERRLQRAQRRLIERAEGRHAQLVRALNAVSPLRVLERGYAVVRRADGPALTQPEDFKEGININILMNNFEVDAEVTSAPRPSKLT
jgi:exodeoxyribonuclease VII large subunit